jgi:Fe-S-cluster containining protein
MARHKNDPEDFPPVVGFNKMFMDFQSILIEWKLNAKWHDGRNFSFLHSLKNESSDEVDRAAWRLHREAFSIIDCTQCANCCKTVSPVFAADDIARIARRLEMDADVFTAQYLVKCNHEQGWEPKSLPCPFLGTDNRCTIYEVRPVACAEYPYTDKPEISSRTHSIAAKALECPAVFYIVEKMRARGLK